MNYAIPFIKIPPEYWLFTYLYYEDYYQENQMKRRKMSRTHSKRSFKKGMNTQRKNLAPAPARGGYRL